MKYELVGKCFTIIVLKENFLTVKSFNFHLISVASGDYA